MASSGARPTGTGGAAGCGCGTLPARKPYQVPMAEATSSGAIQAACSLGSTISIDKPMAMTMTVLTCAISGAASRQLAPSRQARRARSTGAHEGRQALGAGDGFG
jgi:hypothetical protein